MENESDGKLTQYFKVKPYENVYHNDARTTLFTTADSRNKDGGVSFQRDNCYTKTDYLLLRNTHKRFIYTEQHTKNINELKTDKNLYEVLCSGKPIKLAFDIDDKDEGIPISEIIAFCELFKIFMSSDTQSEKQITYTIMISEEADAIFNYNTPYNSYHIVFNIYTKKNLFNKQIVKAFLEANGEHIPFYSRNKAIVDLSYYSNGKYARAVGQSKGKLFNRTDIIRAVDLQNERFTDDITSDMFIMFVNKDTDIFYDYIEPINTAKVYDDYNIQYVIPHYEELIMDWIDALTEHDFINEWTETIHYLLHILKIGGLNGGDPHTPILKQLDEIKGGEGGMTPLKLFLQKSRVSHYDSADMTEQNITFIKNILHTNKHKRLDERNPIFNGIGIRELCEYEIKEIYKQQSKIPSDRLYLVLQTSKAFIKKGVSNKTNKHAYEITADAPHTRGEITYIKADEKNKCSNIDIKQSEDIEQYDYLYDISTKTILIYAFVYKTKGLKCMSEYNVVIETLNGHAVKDLQFCNEKHIEITDWKDKRLLELNHKSELNIIIEAPTSSGKTYNQMRNRLRSVLKYEDRRVCVITDTRSLTSATDEMIKRVFNELGIPLTYFKNYLRYNKDYNKGEEDDINEVNNDNTRLLLVCVDSLMKYTQRFNKDDNLIFTDLIIDEYQNITNGIIKTITNEYVETNRQKEIMNAFYGVIKNAESVSIYDADIYTHDIKRLKKITGKTFDYVKYIGFKQKVSKSVLVLYDDMIEEIIHNYEQGRPQSISVSTKSRANKIYEEFVKKGMSSSMPIVLITSDGAKDSRITEQTQADSKKLKERLCGNTELWREYKLVIYTSTITTGISFNTADGDTPYIYRHYSIIKASATDTPHSTARGQMDRRVRQTQTAECYTAIEGDELSTLTIKPIDYDLYFKKNKDELHTLLLKRNLYAKKENEKDEIILPNEITDLQAHLRHLTANFKNAKDQTARKVIKEIKTECINKLDTLIQAEERFMELNTTKKAREQADNSEFIAFYFKLMRKWGVEIITSNLYPKINAIEKEAIEKKEKDKHIYTKEQADFEAFNTEHRITDYNDKHNQDENMKELGYSGYGQYHAKLYGKCEPYFNQVAFTLIQDKYRTREALTAYTKLYDYEYYDLLRSMILKNVLVNMDDEAKKELNRTDRNLKNDMAYVVYACIMFEMFKGGYILTKGGDAYDYKMFMRDMIITREGEAEIINKDALINGIITDLKPISRYLFKCGGLKVRGVASFEAITLNNYIELAFNYFNTNAKTETYEDGKIGIIFTAEKGTPFRLQETNYEVMPNSEGEKVLIYDGDIDDYYTISELTPYTTYSGLKIPIDYMPKVKRTAHKINGRMYNLIDHYVVENKRKQLQDRLTEQTSTLKKSYTQISYEDAKDIQNQYEKLTAEGQHLTAEKCGLALGGEITEPNVNEPTEFKPARRFYNWKVSNEGVVYNENEIPQNVIIIPNTKIDYKERPIDYDFTDQDKGDKSVSYVMYRNRMFRLNLIVAEAFYTEYDSENSYIVALDGDYTNNHINNIKIYNTKEEFDAYMKTQKQTKNAVKKETTALNRKTQKNEKRECSVCGGNYIVKNKAIHEKTEKHKKALLPTQ